MTFTYFLIYEQRKFSEQIISKKKPIPTLIEDPDIQFGKYSDTNKSEEQLDAWDNAVELFENKNFIQAFLEFFRYLKDPHSDNVTYHLSESIINFSITQGSKIISGFASNTEIEARSDITGYAGNPDIAVMRKLLVDNHNLKFCRFTISDNKFTLKLTTNARSCSPIVLYQSLRELSLEADKYDDSLLNEFKFLEQINFSSIIPLSANEIEVKYNFLIKTIKETLEKAQLPDNQQNTQATNFLMLNLTYKLFYLLSPEGLLLDDLRNIHHQYEQDIESQLNIDQILLKMQTEFHTLSIRSKDEITKSLYRVNSTFSAVENKKIKKISEFLIEKLRIAQSYKDNNNNELQLTICEFIVAYLHFSFGMPAPYYEYFNIFWQITNPLYYSELGFSNKFFNMNSNLIRITAVESEIYIITASYKPEYPKLNFNVTNLEYKSLNDFAHTFLKEISKFEDSFTE